jgi:hypothetical protein
MTNIKPAGNDPCEKLEADFAALCRDWLTARAGLVDPDQPEDDGTTNKLTATYDPAERALLITAAPSRACISRKWEVIDRILAEDAEGFALSPLQLGLGAIMDDLSRF